MSDSKTRTGSTLPREEYTKPGRLQCMLYKELLDGLLVARPMPSERGGILPSSGNGPVWPRVIDHLQLNQDAPFTEKFIAEARPVIVGNDLRFGADSGRTLADYIQVWDSYVAALGLGTYTEQQPKDGMTEDKLELVYRRASGRKKKKSSRKRRKGKGRQRSGKEKQMPEQATQEGETASDAELALALAMSLQGGPLSNSDNSPATMDEESTQQTPPSPQHTDYFDSDSDFERDLADSAWAAEMTLSQHTESSTEARVLHADVPPPRHARSPSPSPASGTIIGRHTFLHDRDELAQHLESVLGYWMGQREPQGVAAHDTSKCGWCEFEEGCEWR